jgi:DTW domain-containing protein
MSRIGKGLSRCLDCQVPRDLCYCARIEQIDNKIPVSIIMHKRERFLTSNTAVVATRALKNSEILLRGMLDQSASNDLHIKEGHVPLVLYPSKDALTLGSKELTEYLAGRTPHLIVPDGSWRQAKRVAKREEALRNVVAVKLADINPSIYRLRRQVMPGRLCTFEAIARSLGRLESPLVEKKLMLTLAAMDHAHAMARGMDKFDDGNPDPLTQRLFLGVRVPKTFHLIQELKQARPDFDWVQEENYHLTLAFIGRLRRSQKELLINALREVAMPSFTLSFSQLDAFESQLEPAVLWIRPKNNPELLLLAQKIRKILTDQGIPFDPKPYVPHWTIARTRGAEIKENELRPWFDQSFNQKKSVREFILLEGHGKKTIYQELEKFKLISDALK